MLGRFEAILEISSAVLEGGTSEKDKNVKVPSQKTHWAFLEALSNV